MEKAYEFDGLSGNLRVFRDEVADMDKVTFAGIAGVCSPFAELFAYVIRDKDSVFIAGTNPETAHKIELKEPGMQITEPTDPSTDVLVLLGGLSMPQYKVKLEDVQNMIDQVLNPNGKLIGLCFMDMFEKAGWDEKLDFDCIINANLEGYVLK